MSKVIDKVHQELLARIDQNKDGKLDRQDVALAISYAKTKAIEEGTKYPLAAMAFAAVVSGFLVFWLTKILGCH